MAGKKKVIVLYGGKSTEHEVSCRSASFVLRNLDPNLYDIQAIGVDKQGRWHPQETQKLLANLDKSVPIDTSPRVSGSKVNQLSTSTSFDPSTSVASAAGAQQPSDVVVFPVIHGTTGEDGSLQGMLDLAEVAYVGPDTLGSAVGMDKIVTKKLAQLAGVAVVPWVEVKKQFWKKQQDRFIKDAETTLGYPMFVKPARLGSSVGVAKAKDRGALIKACDEAFGYDDKLLIEKGMDVREIECAVLGDYDPEVSLPGEVINHTEFYSYEAKYVDKAATSISVPAKLTSEQTEEARALAKRVFQALELYGMARVDLFLEKSTGKYYLNEVNTIPGFTEISQYPMLWEASGLKPKDLIRRLIDLAVARRDERAALKRSH